ncbi:MAG: tRNA (adenosine(37)-N6)-threonylcarbamoyltransferase complex ATPase subunit type 1 TsaE [Luteitalea sp.]
MTSQRSHSEAETARIAEALAARLQPGDVVLIRGDLGAGKTAFVRGLAVGLGAADDDVSSPTFTLMQEYRGGRLPVYHVDLYRLERAADVEDLGLEDVEMGDGVLAVEWPERLARSLPDAIAVEIAIVGDSTRDIRIGPWPAGRAG